MFMVILLDGQLCDLLRTTYANCGYDSIDYYFKNQQAIHRKVLNGIFSTMSTLFCSSKNNECVTSSPSIASSFRGIICVNFL